MADTDIPEFLQYSPADVVEMGRQRGYGPADIAKGVKRHRDTLETWGRANGGDKYFDGIRKVDRDTEEALAGLRDEARRDYMQGALPNAEHREIMVKQLKERDYDPDKLDLDFQQVMAGMKKVDADFDLPIERHYGGKISAGGRDLAHYAMRKGNDEMMDVSLKVPDPEDPLKDRIEFLRVPHATADDVAAEITRRTNEREKLAKDAESMAAPGERFWPGSIWSTSQEEAELRLQEFKDMMNRARGLDDEIKLLQTDGARYLMGERVREELKKPEWRGKVGEYGGLTELYKGLETAGITSAALLTRVGQALGSKDADRRMRELAELQANQGLRHGGSTRRELEGGLWNHAVTGAQQSTGQMLPFLAGGLVTRGGTVLAGAEGELAAQQAGRLGAAGAGMSASAVGGAELDTQQKIDAALAAGDMAKAERLAAGRDLHALLTGLTEGAVERLGASQALNVGRGGLKSAIGEVLQEGIEEPVTGILQRGVVDPVALGERPDVFGEVPLEMLTGILAGGPMVGTSMAVNAGRAPVPQAVAEAEPAPASPMPEQLARPEVEVVPVPPEEVARASEAVNAGGAAVPQATAEAEPATASPTPEQLARPEVEVVPVPPEEVAKAKAAEFQQRGLEQGQTLPASVIPGEEEHVADLTEDDVPEDLPDPADVEDWLMPQDELRQVPQAGGNQFANPRDPSLSPDMMPGNLPADVNAGTDPTPAEAAQLVRDWSRTLPADLLPAGRQLAPAAAVASGPRAASLAFAKAFAGIFRRRVVVVNGLAEHNPGGATNPQFPDMVFLNEKAAKHWHSIAGHEMVHHLEMSHPDLFDRLDRVLAPQVKNLDAANSTYASYNYQGLGRFAKADLNVRREVYADLMGDSMSDPDFWTSLGQMEPGIFMPMARAVWQWFKDVVNALKKQGWESSQYFREVQGAQKALREAMVEFARRENGLPPQQAEAVIKDILSGDNFFQGLNSPPAAPEAMGPGKQGLTRSRLARPDEAEQAYETRADKVVKSAAEAWLDKQTLATAIDLLGGKELPDGIFSEDVKQQAIGQALQRAMGLMDQGDEFARTNARILASKASRIYQDAGREAARSMHQRAVVNHELVPYAPILAAENLLIDRADSVMNKRFEGGAKGGAAKAGELARKSGQQAGDEVARQLSSDQVLQSITETWQKIMEQLTLARQGGGRVINTVRSRLQGMRDAARQRRAAAVQDENLFSGLDAAAREYSDASIIGASLLADGVVDFGRWSREMEAEAGPQSASALQRIYAEASLLFHQELAMENLAAPPGKGHERAILDAEETVQRRAENRASQLIYRTEERLRQGSKDLRTKGPGGDTINRAFREQVTTPLPWGHFAARLQALNVGPDVAARLFQTAQRETADQQAMRLYQQDKAREQRAERQASQLIYRTEERLRQGSRDMGRNAAGDSVNRAFRDQVARPLEPGAFRARLAALNVPGDVADRLHRTAAREAADRGKMREFKAEQDARALAQNAPALARMLNDLRKKMYPGMNWQAIFEALPGQQRERQLAIYDRLRKDERLRGLTRAERVQLTNELDKTWQRERRKVFTRELEKAGALGEKDAVDRKKTQKSAPRLLRAINLGLMTSETFREAIAPEYGLKMLSQADAAKLRGMAEEAYQIVPGVLRSQKLKEMVQFIQKKTRGTWVEIMDNYWTASVLSSLRTLYDTFMAVTNGLGTNLIQAGMLGARGRFTAAKEVHAEWWRGLGEGTKESLRILATGDRTFTKRFNEDMMRALDGEHGVAVVPLSEQLWKEANFFAKAPVAVMLLVGRAMTAADHMNNTATTRGAMAVARALHPELYAERAGWTTEERKMAREQALREMTGGTDASGLSSHDKAILTTRAREILYDGVRPQQREEASQVGDEAAYQNDPTGVFGLMHKILKGGLGSGARLLGNVAEDQSVNRFTRVIAGMAAGSIYAVTGTRFMRFGFNFGADMTRYVPGTYLFDKLGFYGRETSQQQRELLLGKNIVGLLGASMLASMFVGKDDEDEGWHQEGAWSNLSDQQKKERRAAGFEPLTYWKRDERGKITRLYYKQWPLMGIMAAVGGMQDEWRFDRQKFEERGVTGHLGKAFVTGLVQIQNVSAMRNVGELFAGGYGSTPEDTLLTKMQKTTANWVTGFVPRILKDAEAWFDPQIYKPEGVMEAFIADIPMVRQSVAGGRPQLNVLGEPIELNRAPWSRMATTVQTGPEMRMLAQLMTRGVSLPGASDKKMVYRDGEKQALESMGGEVAWKYQKYVGQGYAELLRNEGRSLLGMTPDLAQKTLNRMAERVKSVAMMRVMQP